VAGLTLAHPELVAIAERLAEPVDMERVKTRVVGGGKSATYLPGEAVVDTANQVFGFSNWSDEIRKMAVDYCVCDNTNKWNVGVHAVMRVYMLLDGRPLCWREDVGYGASSRMPQLDAAMEMARKGAITDARKRCLRLFGEALGGSINSEEFQRNAVKAAAAARAAAAAGSSSASGSGAASATSASFGGARSVVSGGGGAAGAAPTPKPPPPPPPPSPCRRTLGSGWWAWCCAATRSRRGGCAATWPCWW